jgi:hypothetical protein
MIEVTALVWIWNPGKGRWHFLTIPPEQAVEIKLQTIGSGRRGGFGSVKVAVQIGKTRWSTSVFPDRKTGGYILPIKADVRRREDIGAGDEVAVTLDLI